MKVCYWGLVSTLFWCGTTLGTVGPASTTTKSVSIKLTGTRQKSKPGLEQAEIDPKLLDQTKRKFDVTSKFPSTNSDRLSVSTKKTRATLIPSVAKKRLDEAKEKTSTVTGGNSSLTKVKMEKKPPLLTATGKKPSAELTTRSGVKTQETITLDKTPTKQKLLQQKGSSVGANDKIHLERKTRPFLTGKTTILKAATKSSFEITKQRNRHDQSSGTFKRNVAEDRFMLSVTQSSNAFGQLVASGARLGSVPFEQSSPKASKIKSDDSLVGGGKVSDGPSVNFSTHQVKARKGGKEVESKSKSNAKQPLQLNRGENVTAKIVKDHGLTKLTLAAHHLDVGDDSRKTEAMHRPLRSGQKNAPTRNVADGHFVEENDLHEDEIHDLAGDIIHWRKNGADLDANDLHVDNEKEELHHGDDDNADRPTHPLAANPFVRSGDDAKDELQRFDDENDDSINHPLVANALLAGVDDANDKLQRVDDNEADGGNHPLAPKALPFGAHENQVQLAGDENVERANLDANQNMLPLVEVEADGDENAVRGNHHLVAKALARSGDDARVELHRVEDGSADDANHPLSKNALALDAHENNLELVDDEKADSANHLFAENAFRLGADANELQLAEDENADGANHSLAQNALALDAHKNILEVFDDEKADSANHLLAENALPLGADANELQLAEDENADGASHSLAQNALAADVIQNKLVVDDEKAEDANHVLAENALPLGVDANELQLAEDESADGANHQLEAHAVPLGVGHNNLQLVDDENADSVNHHSAANALPLFPDVANDDSHRVDDNPLEKTVKVHIADDREAYAVEQENKLQHGGEPNLHHLYDENVDAAKHVPKENGYQGDVDHHKNADAVEHRFHIPGGADDSEMERNDHFPEQSDQVLRMDGDVFAAHQGHVGGAVDLGRGVHGDNDAAQAVNSSRIFDDRPSDDDPLHGIHATKDPAEYLADQNNLVDDIIGHTADDRFVPESDRRYDAIGRNRDAADINGRVADVKAKGIVEAEGDQQVPNMDGAEDLFAVNDQLNVIVQPSSSLIELEEAGGRFNEFDDVNKEAEIVQPADILLPMSPDLEEDNKLNLTNIKKAPSSFRESDVPQMPGDSSAVPRIVSSAMWGLLTIGVAVGAMVCAVSIFRHNRGHDEEKDFLQSGHLRMRNRRKVSD